MSGHSHFATIKRAKEAEDKKRGKIFSKMARVIAIAAKEGGSGDPEKNLKLKNALIKAREVNMPKDNIERAIKKGIGDSSEKMELEEIIVEALGPGGSGIIITGITDNKNRTLGEIKQILNQNNGKMAGEGSVRWQFERKGVLSLNNEDQKKDTEELELTAIEAGADDIYWHENNLEIYAKPEDGDKIKKILEEKGLKIEGPSLDWVAKETVELDEKAKEQCQNMFEALDENDDVQDIYSNIK